MASSHSGADGGEEARLRESERLRVNGKEALERGNAEAARALLAESYRLRPNPETARLLESARCRPVEENDGDQQRCIATRFIAPAYRQPLGILLGLIVLALAARVYKGAPLRLGSLPLLDFTYSSPGQNGSGFFFSFPLGSSLLASFLLSMLARVFSGR